MLAKLEAFGFSANVFSLMCSYLKNRKQKFRINEKFSLERDIIAGVPQESIEEAIIFNMFINDLALFIQHSILSIYADDNSLFVMKKNKDKIKSLLLFYFGKGNNLWELFGTKFLKK